MHPPKPSRLSVAVVAVVVLTVANPLAAIAQTESLSSKNILSHAPKRGICVLAGSLPSSLPTEVALKSELIVFAQLPDADQVKQARHLAEKAKLLGTRVYIEQGDASQIYLADDLADAVFVTNPKAQAKVEVLRVLRPGGYGQVGPAAVVKAFAKNTDDWSHPYHGPDNNPQSQDKAARGPYLTHFMAEPWYAAMPQMSVIAGGRIIKVYGNRTSKQPQWDMLNTMICLNAFNGTTLWKRKLAPGFMYHRNTLLATPDTVYLGDATTLKVIDAATGKLRDQMAVPAAVNDGPVWNWLATDGGVLYAMVGDKEPKVETVKVGQIRGAGWPWWKYPDSNFAMGKTIFALDPKTKKVLWKHRESDLLDGRAMCMANGRIFFYSHQKFLGALDAKTGNVIWKTDSPKVMAAVGDHDKAQHPLWGFITTAYTKCSDKAIYFAGPQRKNIAAVSAKDGKLLWHHPGVGNSQLIIRPEAVYALGQGRINETDSSLKLHPLSGEILARFPSRDRCTRATGCLDSIFTRGGLGGSTAVFDVSKKTPQMGVISPMRPACQDGVTVAHGYLFWGPWMCRCDYTQIGVLSLGSAGKFQYGMKATERDRLQRFGKNNIKLPRIGLTRGDWPTYRRDNAGNTRSTQPIGRDVKRIWTFTPSQKNVATAPVAAGGMIFVSGSDGVVRALSGKNGKLVWSDATGGGMRFPPTVANERLYVGSGDGHVYCYGAVNGQRLWRFRAAPVERRIPVFGSLLSTWPVGSGVVVDNGTAYFAAGNANYNGTHVYAVDANSGQIRWQNNESGHRTDDPTGGAGVQGHFLLHNGKLHMYGGNLSRIVAYDVKDGSCERVGNGHGKDLYVFNGQVYASGLPLYFRQEDSHFVMAADLQTPAGIVDVFDPENLLGRDSEKKARIALTQIRKDGKGKLKAQWTQEPFHDIAAAAVAKNAVVVAGVDYAMKGDETAAIPELRAYGLTDGKLMWRQPLPALPVSWGVAIDRDGRIVVSLQDGRVLGFE